jgi:putative hydrolase of the HAD superfamily
VDAAVLFDFGGTLDADGLPWKERFAALFAEHGVAVPPERFDPVFYAADDALVGAVPETLSFRDTVEQLAAAVARALRPGDPALGPRVAGRFLGDALAQLRRNAPLLARLAARYRLGIVSNFYGNLVTVCDNSGVRSHFSVIVDSSRVGFTKPDPRIFLKAVDALRVAPAAVTFVGDSLARDMAGARACGMRHIWLVGDRREAREPCCPGDRVLSSLGELEGVLL